MENNEIRKKRFWGSVGTGSMHRTFWVAVQLVTLCVSNANAADIKLFYFCRADCPWCERFDAVMRDDAVAEIIKKNIDIVKVNVQGSRQINEKFLRIGCKVSPQTNEEAAGKSSTVPWRCPIGTKDIHEDDLVNRLAIKQTPTLIFFSSAGEELLRIPGFLPKEDFLELLFGNVRGIKGCR